MRAPSARPRRLISASPRVMSAARAFMPSCRPSHSPVAMASTFFTAPPTSTPTMSSLAYTRRLGPWKARTSALRTAACSLAATSAVGRASATSWAKLGPLSTPACRRGATWAHTSCASRPRPWLPGATASKPLHSQATGTLHSCRDCSMPRSAAMGVATTSRSAPCTAAGTLPAASARRSGRATPGR